MIVDISTNVCSSPKLSTVQKVHGGGSPHFGTYINFQSKAYTHTRVGTVHVFVPNRDGTGNSVQCMRPYDEFRQFTPNAEGAPAVMQRCLITASRTTANAMSCALENKAH